MSDLQLALEVYKIAASSLNDLWTAFSVVSLGVLGFLYKGKEMPETPATRLFAMAYLVFGLGNDFAIRNTQRTLVSAAVEMRNRSGCAITWTEGQKGVCAIRPNSVNQVQTYQGGVSLLVLLGILVPPWLARRGDTR